MNAIGQGDDGRPLEPAEAYDAAAECYDTWHWQKVWHFVERGPVQKAMCNTNIGSRVLDVGCGTGTLLGMLAHTDCTKMALTGVDVSKRMLERAQQKFPTSHINFIHANFLNLDIEHRSFDIVFMLRVASHIEDLRSCFCKISKILASGGKFVFSDVYSNHQYELTRLPYYGKKIPVTTYKHKLPDILRIAYSCALLPERVEGYSAKDLPDLLKADPDIPHVLLDQLINGRPMPFGCLIIFSLKT